MYFDIPPEPTPWVLESFVYYNHSCKIKNFGGYRNPEAMEKQYVEALWRSKWRAYTGRWYVYFDNQLLLVTPSKQEAIRKMEVLKAKCIAMHNACPGNKAIEEWTKAEEIGQIE